MSELSESQIDDIGAKFGALTRSMLADADVHAWVASDPHTGGVTVTVRHDPMGANLRSVIESLFTFTCAGFEMRDAPFNRESLEQLTATIEGLPRRRDAEDDRIIGDALSAFEYCLILTEDRVDE